MDVRVERLDPAVQHLGEAGEVRDLPHGEPGVGQGQVGAAGADQLRAHGLESPGELHDARLIRHADQGTPWSHLRCPGASLHHIPL